MVKDNFSPPIFPECWYAVFLIGFHENNAVMQ